MAVIVITGCSSGFGLETAVAFARRGDDVVATARDPDRADALLARAKEFSNLSVERLDVTDQDSIEHVVGSTVAARGAIDVLVNNAGIGVVGALEVLDAAMLKQVFDTNVFGAVAVTRAVLPHMRERGAGRVIFMNAIGGILTTAYLGAYCASKHALDCIAAVFDLELRDFGIQVSSVYPSAFQTAMADNMPAVIDERSPYAAPTADYRAALTARMRSGSANLAPVVNAVLEAATDEKPQLRYLVAPHLADVLAPTLSNLDALHQREVATTAR